MRQDALWTDFKLHEFAAGIEAQMQQVEYEAALDAGELWEEAGLCMLRNLPSYTVRRNLRSSASASKGRPQDRVGAGV